MPETDEINHGKKELISLTTSVSLGVGLFHVKLQVNASQNRALSGLIKDTKGANRAY